MTSASSLFSLSFNVNLRSLGERKAAASGVNLRTVRDAEIDPD
jgi:hypothetical protein